MEKQGRLYLKLIAYLSLLLISIAVVYSSIFGTEEETFRVLIRWSAKMAAILFAIAFGISSVAYFFKAKCLQSILAYRPHIGLAFMVFHTFHLCSLVYLQMYIHPVFELAKVSSLFAGTVAYVFIFLMALTTFPTCKNRLSIKTWKALHIIGGYWIWAIFFNSYFKNVMNKQQYYFLFVLFVCVLLFRTAKWMDKKYMR